MNFVPCNLGIKFLRQLDKHVCSKASVSNCMKHTTATQLLLQGTVLRNTVTITKQTLLPVNKRVGILCSTFHNSPYITFPKSPEWINALKI